MVATLLAPPSRSSRLIGAKQDNRRFLADAFGIAPDIAIEHRHRR